MAISFKGNIKSLFSPGDISCMKAYGVKLDDYAWMSDASGGHGFPDHSHARDVLARLRGTQQPRMPKGGPYWSDQRIKLFEQWMTDGYQT